jgi:hypothetical protein
MIIDYNLLDIDEVNQIINQAKNNNELELLLQDESQYIWECMNTPPEGDYYARI